MAFSSKSVSSAGLTKRDPPAVVYRQRENRGIPKYQNQVLAYQAGSTARRFRERLVGNIEKGIKRRLVVTGIMAGTALAAKHSGLIVLPVLATLALAELIGGKRPTSADKPWTSNRLVSTASTVVFVALIAYVWGIRSKANASGR